MIKLVSTVGFIIINEEKKILLVNRCNKKEKDKIESDSVVVHEIESDEKFADLWMIPSGNLEDNDNPRDVIKKEVKKCLNCEVGECNYFNLYFYNISDNFIKEVSYFFGSIEGEINVKNEQIAIKWITLDKNEIENLRLDSEQKTVLVEFIDFFQNKLIETK